MREFKFRVYSPEEEKMSKHFSFNCDVLSFTDENGLGRIRSPKPSDIFMEWVGAYDDDGKPVFEGDIVQYDHEDGIVIAQVIHKQNNDESMWLSGLAFQLIRVVEYDDVEAEGVKYLVLGNIYENPELIK